jgi:hypothetical protein
VGYANPTAAAGLSLGDPGYLQGSFNGNYWDPVYQLTFGPAFPVRVTDIYIDALWQVTDDEPEERDPFIRVHVEHFEIEYGTGEDPVRVEDPMLGERFENVGEDVWRYGYEEHRVGINAASNRNTRDLDYFAGLEFVRWDEESVIRFYRIDEEGEELLGTAPLTTDNGVTTADIAEYFENATTADFETFPDGVTDIVIDALWQRTEDEPEDTPRTPPRRPPGTPGGPGGPGSGGGEGEGGGADPPPGGPGSRGQLPPGGNNPNIPPNPMFAGSTVVQSGVDSNGYDTYVEISDTGVPLGDWTWDDDDEYWIFDDRVPLGAMPRTGLTDNTMMLMTLFSLSIATAAVALFAIRREQSNKVRGQKSMRRAMQAERLRRIAMG